MSTTDQLQGEIENLKEEIVAKQLLLSLIASDFPDLVRHVDRWGDHRYESRHANTVVTDVHIVHACGCCADAPLYIWPYLKIGDQQIYAKGIPFYIGDRYGYSGELPAEDWKKTLKAANLPDAILEQVATYFKENPPRFSDYEDEDG